MPGDVIQMVAGDKVPADVRIVQCSKDLYRKSVIFVIDHRFHSSHYILKSLNTA